MGKTLVAYVSVEGHTERLAQFIAEGARMKGHQVDLKKVSEIKSAEALEGYDAYFLGCPTYHRDLTQNMKTFLFLMKKVELKDKVAGAFGTYTHDGNAPQIILDTMQHVFKMKPTTLGSLNLLEHLLDDGSGMKAGHDYAKATLELLEN